MSSCCHFIDFLLHFASKHWSLSWAFCSFPVAHVGMDVLLGVLFWWCFLSLRAQVWFSVSTFSLIVCSKVSPSSPFSLFLFWHLLLYVCYTFDRSPSFFLSLLFLSWAALLVSQLDGAWWRGLRSGPSGLWAPSKSLLLSFRAFIISTFIQYDFHIL